MEDVLNDLLSSFAGGFLYGLTWGDMAVPFGLLMWFLLLWVSLKGLNLSNMIAALTYVAFCIFVGVVDVLVIPATYGKRTTFKFDLLFVIFFGVVASLKWSNELRRRKQAWKLVKMKRGEESNVEQ